ncbi:DUF2785 domain-containing protein [Roseateles sp. NT4]|uniref:DUF2785 domain-containing protein n=1 Tax=Roseateles sp. NT4 TaxID=3453715 RepID=UPI003EEC1DF5
MNKPRLTLATLLLAAFNAWAAPSCSPPANVQGEQDPARIQQLAEDLLPCLASPDPQLRDLIGFETLYAWARAGKLQPATLQRLRVQLLAVLDSPPDAAGVHQPFAALALSEVARVDRVQPYLSPAEREDLVAHAARYLAGVRDYRGFSATEGWRHGVAHGADLALQLGVNDAINAEQRRRLLAAVSQQVLADHKHSYRYGEGARLARAALNIQLKLGADAAHTAEWQRWLDELAAPAMKAKALDETAWTDLHNLREFLWPLLTQVLDLQDAALRARLQLPLQTVLRGLP